ncbi:unnamed protein product [Prunus armeniaca]
MGTTGIGLHRRGRIVGSVGGRLVPKGSAVLGPVGRRPSCPCASWPVVGRPCCRSFLLADPNAVDWRESVVSREVGM